MTPNNAFERRMMVFMTTGIDESDYRLGAEQHVWCSAQRER